MLRGKFILIDCVNYIIDKSIISFKWFAMTFAVFLKTKDLSLG